MGFITKKLLENGAKIGFAYREQPDNEYDSGWRFFTGEEDQEYVDNADNILFLPIADIIKIDDSIKGILENNYNTAYEKENNTFRKVDYPFEAN